MPTFNLSSKPDDASMAVEQPPPVVSELSLRMEDLTFTETPPSRSLADSLANLIHNRDNNKPSDFDSTLGKTLGKTLFRKIFL